MANPLDTRLATLWASLAPLAPQRKELRAISARLESAELIRSLLGMAAQLGLAQVQVDFERDDALYAQLSISHLPAPEPVQSIDYWDWEETSAGPLPEGQTVKSILDTTSAWLNEHHEELCQNHLHLSGWGLSGRPMAPEEVDAYVTQALGPGFQQEARDRSRATQRQANLADRPSSLSRPRRRS